MHSDSLTQWPNRPSCYAFLKNFYLRLKILIEKHKSVVPETPNVTVDVSPDCLCMWITVWLLFSCVLDVCMVTSASVDCIRSSKPFCTADSM